MCGILARTPNQKIYQILVPNFLSFSAIAGPCNQAVASVVASTPPKVYIF